MFDVEETVKDPTKGVLFIDGILVFLPNVLSIEPYGDYDGDDESNTEYSRITFKGKHQIYVHKSPKEIFKLI